MIRQTCCFVLFEWTNQICCQVRAKGFPAMPDVTALWRVAINETLAKASWGWKNGYLLARKTLKCIVVSISVTVYKSCCFFLLAQCTAQGYCTVWPKKKTQIPVCQRQADAWDPLPPVSLVPQDERGVSEGITAVGKASGGATLPAALPWKLNIHSNSTKTPDRIPMPSFSSISFLSFPRKTQWSLLLHSRSQQPQIDPLSHCSYFTPPALPFK